MVTAAEQDACIDLVYHEAELLDDRRFRDWLALFTPDAVYWVPLREGQTDPHGEPNIIYDNLNRMDDRIYRIESGASLAQDPPSRTARTISNFRVRAGDAPDTFVVRSTFMLVEVRPDCPQQILGGHYTHHLRRDAGETGWRIARKRVDLVNSEEPQGNLTYIL